VSIIEELLGSLKEADFNIKEDIVQKTALLAEKFSTDSKWYTDVIIQLMTYAGDYVSNDIWFRLVQVVTGFGDSPNTVLQEYAVGKAVAALTLAHVHDNMIKLASVLIGEFSNYVADPTGVFENFQKHFPHCSVETKCMVLSCYMKLTHAYPSLVNITFGIFEHHTYHVNPDLQQRAIEYYNLCSENFEEMRNAVVFALPTYNEDVQKQNMLIQKIVSYETQAEEKLVVAAVKSEPVTVDLLDL
jgi:AP-2 complex subunit alpha